MNLKHIILGAALSLSAFSSGDQPFVIGRLLGQLGNQMFEIATASAVAWDNGAEAYFPDLQPQSEAFQHIFYNIKTTTPEGNIDYRYGTSPFGYTPIPYYPNMEISGYCQNEKYFAHRRDQLVKLFSPRSRDLKYIQSKYGNLMQQNTVSIHLRYYYAEKPDEESFVQYEREYYEKAMAFFPNDSVFIVTSDNIDFAKQNIPTDGYQVYFIEKEPFYIDFFIQSMCKHNIIANSTFSWWSAWLNQNPDKIVVRPEVWLQGYPDIGGPDEWIRVPAQGMKR